MNIELKNKAAYDLALEYVRQNNAMKVSTELTLEDQVENFKKTYMTEYSNALIIYHKSFIGVFPNFLITALKVQAD